MSEIRKNRAVINLATGEFQLTTWVYSGPDPDPEIPEAEAGFVAVEVTGDDLGGLTLDEFWAAKKPVLGGSPLTFTGWEDRDSGLELAISENPKDDGSNTPTITLSTGLPNSPYRARFTRYVSCSLTGCAGVLDGSGEASWMIRVQGGGDFTLFVEPDGHSDFSPVSLAIVTDMGGFP